MLRKIAYWAATGVVGIATLAAAFSYLSGAHEAVENFRHVGYPQQLRVLLGIGKFGGALVLLLPRLPALKEWAYAGFTFMWIAATVAHYLAADGKAFMPVVLLGMLAVSYVTRSAERGGFVTSQAYGSSPLPADGSTASAVASKTFALDQQ